MLFAAVFLLCLLIFVFVSRTAALLLFTGMFVAGREIAKKDAQLPLLWLHSLSQSGSYDPAKFEDEQ